MKKIGLRMSSADETPTEQESRVARVLGGRRVSGSGASMYAKGDAITDKYLVECKQTEKASIGLKREWLDKIAYEAAATGRLPLLAFEIKGVTSKRKEGDFALRGHSERDWVCVPLRVFSELLSECEDKKDHG